MCLGWLVAPDIGSHVNWESQVQTYSVLERSLFTVATPFTGSAMLPRSLKSLDVLPQKNWAVQGTGSAALPDHAIPNSTRRNAGGEQPSLRLGWARPALATLVKNEVKYRPDSFGQVSAFSSFFPLHRKNESCQCIASTSVRPSVPGLLLLPEHLLPADRFGPIRPSNPTTPSNPRNPAFVSTHAFISDCRASATITYRLVSSPNSLEPSQVKLCDNFATPPDQILVASHFPGPTAPMAGMARHRSASAYQGFSVCQPALGSALQWLPAIGTPELDDMINAFIPGPASIQDKRTHIAMDFFEYSRQTGETFKFYPVPSAAFTPVTESPASSALYDSGYGSGFNLSPVVSDQGSWTQSPAAFTPPMPADAGVRSRSSASRKPSSSSSRQAAVDFSNHPGMRIMTKDGRDVTNSASRGCKTKEQRDHAHLMRIIKACDSCRRKKIRCDPSHKKRTASQASASQTEQKPAKKPRKAEEAPPAAAEGVAADFVDANFDPAGAPLDLASFDVSFQDIEEYWNQFITFDQEPVAVATQRGGDFDCDFNSFIDFQSFSSPSSLSSSTSPSQVFTPYTPAAPGASPTVASDAAVDVAGDVSLDDPTVPYLNPDVPHGTYYVDFNLFSPGPDALDEDPVLQMRDVASLQRSPPSHSVATITSAANDSQHAHNSPTTSQTSRISDLGSNASVVGQPDAVRSSPGRRPLSRSAVLHTFANSYTSSIVSANVTESSVSPGSSPRPRRSPQIHSAADSVASGVGMLDSPSCPESQLATRGTLPRAASQLCRLDRGVGVSSYGYGCGRGSLSRQLQTGVKSRSCGVAKGQHVVQRSTSVLIATVNAELATTVISTSPTRRIPAGEDVKNGPTSQALSPTVFFQLAVFGLVSLLCASALQAHLASQVGIATIVTTILSLTPLALGCVGASSATRVASTSLLIPTPPGIVDHVKSKIQAVDSNLRSTVLRRARDVPRLASVGSC